MERPTHTEDYVSAYNLRGHAPSILMCLQIKIKVTDNPLFPFSDRLPSVFSALGEKAIS